MPDALRKRVLWLIGKGAAVVGQERIAHTDAVASGDRHPTLLHCREAADSHCDFWKQFPTRINRENILKHRGDSITPSTQIGISIHTELSRCHRMILECEDGHFAVIDVALVIAVGELRRDIS